ncbi:DEAD/DEAH box helicase [Parvicella tangerina]|uniref:RNA helicase n=1 Tax=Parvicella tangerina TaxID=2829795 RepID=A0A916NID0_9FLAO|nr:DEAD/DEAH box helicase [Parvicella tangerina]CAG5084948.1 ATP-dependent RNA helicase DeaD [Parvicella tangerina]
MKFSEIGLSEETLSALNDLGFEKPTQIQEEAIPQLLETERDLVGLAQTGTGKTASFGLPMIEKVDFNKSHVQALVIAPTRELCVQISKDIQDFAKYHKNAKVATIYGGASIDKQAREIKRGAQIVSATPGRLIDMIKRRLVNLKDVEIVVLDEADEMLNMGFKEDIDSILDGTPEDKSVWLFSATMPKDVAKIAKTYMENPIEITVGSKNSSNENITHEYYCVQNRNRYYALKRVLDINPNIYGLVFCRTKRETQEVADKLMRDGYNAEPLHGDLSQMQRDKVMEKFRDKTLQILVATDVAARGIDVDDITHVINYNLPDDIENYTHRSGRTARAGKHGVSLVFVTPKEVYRIKQVEKVIQKKFSLEEVPSGEDICREQLFALVDNIKRIEIKEDQIDDYLPTIMELFEDYSKEELIKRFVGAEFNKFLEYYERSGDLNADPKGKDEGRGRDRGRDRDGGRGRDRGRGRGKGRDDNKERFFVNLGLSAGLNKGAIVRLVCNETGISSADIGRIDLFNEFSFFDADPQHKDVILDRGANMDYDGKRMKIELAGKGGGGKSKGKRGGKDRSRGGDQPTGKRRSGGKKGGRRKGRK